MLSIRQRQRASAVSTSKRVAAQNRGAINVKAFNVVRFRVKPGRENDFIDTQRKFRPDFVGFKRFIMIKTGDRTYCVMGEWDNYQNMVAARPKMIAMLDTFRDTLEDLGSGLGVTDPVSGEVVLEM
jgi:hypothetical protein